MALSPATAKNSGITNTHRPAIHEVCKEENTFLFIRPSEEATMRLIDAGFATKSTDIHDKSSNWNLTAGLVPVDQAFSKRRTGDPDDKIHPHDHGEAKPVHLVFKQEQFSKLWSAGHFEGVSKVKTGTCVKDLKTYEHFHATQKTDVCFLYEKSSGKVFWRWRPHLVGKTTDPIPMYVWAYNGIPVTGDYDLWMVAPHVTNPDWGIIESVTDLHGRSAAAKYTTDLMKKLNKRCYRPDNPVFNHGAEAQNYSFTQERDETIAMFCPGSQSPKSVPWDDLPKVLHDLLRNGYVVIRNPKWITGETLATEDFAYAEPLFPKHHFVIGGKEAKSKLEKGKKVSSSEWSERSRKLNFLRLVAKIPDLDKKKNLILVDEGYFQSKARWVKLGHTIHKHIGDLARKYSKEVEEGFGRAGFILLEGYPLLPIDMTIDRIEEAKCLTLDVALAALKPDIAKMAVENIRDKMKELPIDKKFFETCPFEDKTSELRWILGILWGLKSAGKVSVTHYRELHRFLVHWAEERETRTKKQKVFVWYIGEPLQKTYRDYVRDLAESLAGQAAKGLTEKLGTKGVDVSKGKLEDPKKELDRVLKELVKQWEGASVSEADFKEYLRFVAHWEGQPTLKSSQTPFVWTI